MNAISVVTLRNKATFSVYFARVATLLSDSMQTGLLDG